jgi:DNA polymerase-3 subunit delta
MIIFIHGPDTYRSREKLAQFRDQFIKKRDQHGLSTVTLDGESLTVDEFRKAIYSPSLFSEKRMIIVERLVATIKDKDLMTEIINFLQKTKSDKQNVLVFWEEIFEENEINKRLLSLLIREKYVYFFPLLNQLEVEAWIRKEIANRGGKIEPLAVKLLADLVGSDLWRARNELEKLLAYGSQETFTLISSRMVLDLTPPPLEEKIWLFIDALAEKNKKRALKLLSDQIASGVSYGYLISMLARQFRIIFSVKEILEKFPRLNYQSVAERLKLRLYVCQKAITQAKNYHFSEIKKIYQNLVGIDLKSKTTKIEPEVLLDLLIVKL